MNKIKLIYALAMCLCFFGFQTQTIAQIGVKGGVNIASLLQENTADEFENLNDNAIIGYQAGLFFDIPLTEKFSFQPEFLYIQKGGKQTFDISLLSQRAENKVFYNYIEVPVLFKYAFNGNDDSGLYLIGGPFAGLVMNGKNELVVTNLNTEESSTTSNEFDYSNENSQKRLDYGTSVGLGFQLGRLILDARYNLGINNLIDNDANNNNDNKATVKTRGIALTAGIKF